MAGTTAAVSIKRLVKPFIPRTWVLRKAFYSELAGGEAELKIVPLLCKRRQTCIDVGANMGVYSYVFSKWSKSVIAIEPHPRLALRLKELFLESVRVINIAASDREGVSEFHIPFANGAEISTRSSLEFGANPGMAAHSIRVETRRLDSLSLDPNTVGVVKIDVEGHELNALAGMTGILEQSRPALIVESEARHNKNNPGMVFSFLRKYGYEGYFIYRNRLVPLSEFSVEELQNEINLKPVFGARSQEYVNNFIFVHWDRTDLIDAMTNVYPLMLKRK
jgi:FkbM family methyltransferase